MIKEDRVHYVCVYLIENVANPLGHHKGYHDGKAKAYVPCGFNENDCQTQGHAHYASWKNTKYKVSTWHTLHQSKLWWLVVEKMTQSQQLGYGKTEWQ